MEHAVIFELIDGTQATIKFKTKLGVGRIMSIIESCCDIKKLPEQVKRDAVEINLHMWNTMLLSQILIFNDKIPSLEFLYENTDIENMQKIISDVHKYFAPQKAVILIVSGLFTPRLRKKKTGEKPKPNST